MLLLPCQCFASKCVFNDSYVFGSDYPCQRFFGGGLTLTVTVGKIATFGGFDAGNVIEIARPNTHSATNP